MKFFIIFALIAITSAEEWKRKTYEEWMQINRACDRKYEVPTELIGKAETDKYPPKEVFQVVLCILREAGVWSDTEGFSIDRLMIGMENFAAKRNINRQFLRESLESCVDKNSEGSSKLDWAFRNFKCYKDNEKLFSVLRETQFHENYVDEKDKHADIK